MTSSPAPTVSTTISTLVKWILTLPPLNSYLFITLPKLPSVFFPFQNPRVSLLVALFMYNKDIKSIAEFPFSSSSKAQAPFTKPQEGAWKKFGRIPTQAPFTRTWESDHTSTTALGGIIDFLTRAFNDPSPASALVDDLSLPLSAGLSLNSGHANNPSSNGGASPTGSGFFAYCSKKRALEKQREASLGNGNGMDR